MTNRYQNLRSSISGNLPAQGTRQVGELWVNFPDLQMGHIDASKTAQKLIAVRYFSATAAYAQGDMVVQAGAIYVANAAVAAGAFNATQWTKLATTGDLATGFVPLAGGTMTGPLILSADPLGALGAATKQYVDNTVGGGFLPITGGTVTGALTVQGAFTAASPANVNLSPTGSGTVTIAPATLGHMNNTQIGGVTPANGTFLTLSATGAATFSPAGASVAISPTAGGTVTINPAAAGTINNMAIGGSVAAAGSFTGVTASGNVTSASAVLSPTVYFGWPTYTDCYISSNASYTIFLEGAGWYYQWVRASGQRNWVNGSGGVLMGLDPAGNLTTNQHIHAGSGNGYYFYGNSVQTSTAFKGYPSYSDWYETFGSGLKYYSWQGGNYSFSWNTTNGIFQYNTPNGAMMQCNPDGSFFVGLQGYKPGGGAWQASSDIRIKTVKGEYPQGLDAINKLRPVVYSYKGNDTPTADFDLPVFEEPQAAVDAREEAEKLGVEPATQSLPVGVKSVPPRGVTEAPYPASPHYQVAVAEKLFTGLVAQEVETIFPEMVAERAGYIDGKAVADIKDLDTGPLLFALVNAVKELSARVVALEGAP
jgi:Chaperone of endosialidase